MTRSFLLITLFVTCSAFCLSLLSAIPNFPCLGLISLICPTTSWYAFAPNVVTLLSISSFPLLWECTCMLCVRVCMDCLCACMHTCACVSRVSEKYYCKHIIWWGEWFRLLAGCPAFIWNRAANIWTVSTLTDSVCAYASVCVCLRVYWGPCISPRAVRHWMGNRFAEINQRCSINKRNPLSPCLQAAILRAWESSLTSSKMSSRHRQPVLLSQTGKI